MQKILCAWIATIALACVPVRAEEIQLKDGTKVTGKLTGITNDTFQVKTAYGDIQVPRAQVISINFPENQPKKESDGEERQAKSAIEESLNGATYTNVTEKFHVNVPKGWLLAPELAKQSADIAAALKSPDQIYFFFVTPEKYLGTLATYKVLVETQYQLKFKDYEKMSESQIQLDGKNGIRMIWRGKNAAANNASMKSLVYIVPYENRMVRLTFLTLEPLFDDGVPTFERSHPLIKQPQRKANSL
jgi:hypothetical protein